jgi:serine/threonine protein kinase
LSATEEEEVAKQLTGTVGMSVDIIPVPISPKEPPLLTLPPVPPVPPVPLALFTGSEETTSFDADVGDPECGRGPTTPNCNTTLSPEPPEDDDNCVNIRDVVDELAAEKAFDESKLHKKMPSKINRANVNMIQRLNSGEFGEVWKAELDQSGDGDPPGYIVAVKQVKPGSPKEACAALLKEAALMAQISGSGACHPNVISLVGLVDDGIGPTLAVIAYCEYGSLKSYLKKSALTSGVAVDAIFRVTAGVEVSAAMAFLASKGIVHRDLAARNVLVDSKKTMRVSDFGMSRQENQQPSNRESAYAVYSTKKEVPLPFRWTAPEVFNTSRFTTSSDVWAFGMLMIEVYTDGEKPFPHYLTSIMIPGAVTHGEQPVQPTGCPPGVYSLLQQCWNLDSKQRPSFESICSQMQTLCEESLETSLLLSAVEDDEVANLMAMRRQSDDDDRYRLGSDAAKYDALSAVERDGMALMHLSSEMRRDRSVVLAAVAQNQNSLKFACKTLLEDGAFAMQAIGPDGNGFEHLSGMLRGDKQFVLNAMQTKSWAVLAHATAALQADKDLTRAALEQQQESVAVERQINGGNGALSKRCGGGGSDVNSAGGGGSGNEIRDKPDACGSVETGIGDGDGESGSDDETSYWF